MVQRLFELDSSLPNWLRPTYRGAIYILAMGFGWTGKLFVLTLLATLMLMAGAGPGLALFFGLLAAAAAAGAVAGTIRGILEPLERWGLAGSWLRWTLTIFGYLAAIGLLMPKGPFSDPYPAFYALVAGVCALAAGCLLLLDDRRLGRLSPRKFRLRQGRERMWAAATLARSRLLSRPAY